MFTDRATLLLMGTAKVPNANAEPNAANQPQISQLFEDDMRHCYSAIKGPIIFKTVHKQNQTHSYRMTFMVKCIGNRKFAVVEYFANSCFKIRENEVRHRFQQLR